LQGEQITETDLLNDIILFAPAMLINNEYLGGV
jgi:hypothetical protein